MARTYRFFLRHSVVTDGQLSLTEKNEPEIFFQLIKVLRAEAGDKIILVQSDQQAPFFEYVYLLKIANKKELGLDFQEKIENNNELPFDLGLVLALPNKPDKLEFILQKAVELGVKYVKLVEADFSQMKHQLRMDRLEKIIVEAAEQSERAIIPSIRLERSLSAFLGQHKNEKLMIAMERSTEAKDLFKTIDLQDGTAIVVGPEGGFSPEEKGLIAELGLPCFSLGKRILRMETAAILSLGLVALLASNNQEHALDQ